MVGAKRETEAVPVPLQIQNQTLLVVFVELLSPVQL